MSAFQQWRINISLAILCRSQRCLNNLVTFYRRKHFFRIFPRRVQFLVKLSAMVARHHTNLFTNARPWDTALHPLLRRSQFWIASIEITSRYNYRGDELFGLLSSSVYSCQCYYSLLSGSRNGFYTVILIVLVTCQLSLRWVWLVTLRWFLDMWEEIQSARLNVIFTHSQLCTVGLLSYLNHNHSSLNISRISNNLRLKLHRCVL